MADRTRMVWMNGRIVPEAEAKVSIYDSALMFGDMVFEMTRSFRKKQFKLREHLERLYDSVKRVQIPLGMPLEDLEHHVHETIEVNEPLFSSDDEHRILINVSRGLLGIYENVVGVESGPNVMIADFPLRWTVVGMGRLFDHGINCIIPSQRAIPEQLMDPKIKNRSRLFYMMANIEVSKHEGEDNWALLLDPDGFVTEGTGANFFMVKNGVLHTPEPRNILCGISRAYVMDLAAQHGLTCKERNISPDEIESADEAFFTGTPFCMLPVTRFHGRPIGYGGVGHHTTRLVEQWSKNVGVDVVAQIQAWDSAARAEGDRNPTPYAFRTPRSNQRSTG